MNRGKLFESQVRKSIPEEVIYERFIDNSSSYYQGNSNLRFSPSNVCDCFLYDGEILIYLELKSHLGKSLPISCIRENQKNELLKRSRYVNTKAGILVEFRDVSRCFYLSIEEYCLFLDTLGTERKSIPISYFENYGIEVGMTLKRTNYTYEIGEMINEIKNS